jgi:rhamnose transport system permease protein
MSWFKRREVALAAIVLALIVLVGLRAPVFLSASSIYGMLVDTSFLFMLVLAQMAIILTRGIDLSVASNLALTGMVTALFAAAYPGVPMPLVLILALVVGGFFGLINGMLIANLNIPPIVVTLGTLAVYRGLIFVIAGGAWLTSDDMSPAFVDFPKLNILGISVLLWFAVLVSAAFYLFLNYTAAGRSLYAIGGNPVAARFCGINIPGHLLLVYALAGAVSGLCGTLWVSRYGIAYVDIANGFELTIIAACVIGGVSIAGGIGSVPGALLGALFLGVVVNALPVINVSPFWQMAISGAVILAAVIINARNERRSGKLILPEARRAAAGGKS